MHGAVDRETGGIDRPGRVFHLVAVMIHLDQTRGGDLIEQHAIGVDQEMLGAGHARTDVREHQIVPVEVRHQPVGGSKVDAHRPFLGGMAAGVGGRDSGHDRLRRSGMRETG
jgi:hypothetical protein